MIDGTLEKGLGAWLNRLVGCNLDAFGIDRLEEEIWHVSIN